MSRVGIVPERRGRRAKPERLRTTQDQRLEREREELTRIFASWNQLEVWLRQLNVFRSLACSTS